MPAKYIPLINGKNYDWGNITCVLYGVPVVGITEINWGTTRERPNNYGAGYDPISYGNKNNVYAGDISIYWDELLAIAANKIVPLTDIPPDTIVVEFGGDGLVDQIIRIKNVRFTSNPFGGKQNDSLFVMKLPFVFAGLG